MTVKYFISYAMLLIFTTILSGCISPSPESTYAVNDQQSADLSAPPPRSIDDTLIVDCILPGQVRKLGRMTYMTARRPVKTTALMCEIQGGEYVAYDRSNTATALTVWMEKALEGDPAAQTYVGEIYLKGIGGTPQYSLAAEWFKKAATQGSTRSKLNLGYLYEMGLGVPKNPKTAVSWYRKANGLNAPNLKINESVPNKSDQSQINLLEQQIQEQSILLKQRQSESDKLKKEVDRLNRDAETYRIKISKFDKEAKQKLPGPTISLIDPKPVLTRGLNLVTVKEKTITRQIIGKVDAPAGLSQLQINEATYPITIDGIFKAAIPLKSTGNTQVKITAVDRQGEKSDVAFILSPEKKRAPFNPGHYHALVIGNNAYTNLPDLQTAINDAKKIADILTVHYGFQVTRLLDATRYDIYMALNEFRKKLTEKDNFLIYYAGHGELDKTNHRGYWLPVDATADSHINSIPNTTVTDILNIMSVKQALIIADTCYSGIMTRSVVSSREASGMSEEKRFEWLKSLIKERSRTVLTSGGLKPVLDGGGGNHSIFAKALINTLQDNREILEAGLLHRRVGEIVSHSSKRMGYQQIPRYAANLHAGHVAGDFLFVPIL